MIRNYFRTAWRNLVRHKAFSMINLLGLSLGITCSLLIMLWIQDERSVDRFHANGQQLYHVWERSFFEGKVEAGYITQGPLAAELKKLVPEVQQAASLEVNTLHTFQVDSKVAKMEGSYAGEDFFSMFSYPLLEGTPQAALKAPGGIAISHKMAERFFGSADKAIGKTIRFENKEDLRVTAVFENLPINSSIQFDFLRTWADYTPDNAWASSWTSASPLTFVQLRPSADPAKVQAKIKDFLKRYANPNDAARTELALQPYADKYLHGNFKEGQLAGGRIEYVNSSGLIALIVLLIACINFMNLATARSAKRAREVGIRKVAGARRGTLILQFVGEAMLLTFCAMGVALFLTTVLLPAFNNLTGKQLVMPVQQPVFWLCVTGLLVITGFVAGSYPALFLSSLQPIRVLKGGLRFSPSAAMFRKGLVVFQFSLSMILIVGMIVIYRQMDYVQAANLGFDRENLIYIPIEGELTSKHELFKKEASDLPGILSVSRMKQAPTAHDHYSGDIGWPGKAPNQQVLIADASVGYDFVKTMNLTLLEGRDFSRDFGNEENSYLLNEAAVKKMGYQHPVGQPLFWGSSQGTIIGVLKDFHVNSLHQAIEPLVIRLQNNASWGNLLVRTRAGKTKEVLAGLENICKTLNPQFPFTWQFADEQYTRLYKNEQVVSKLTNFFAFLAIFISCLGLFGLAAFTAEQRTKEIGVRKVLGASVPVIVKMLSANFLRPVAIAMLVAFPIAWYVMHQWLQNFAYKIDIAWWVFLLAGAITVGIALLTVSFQSIKAARMNPVKSLRSE
ncbi:ABC transporter permease [Paraflavitalea soli]|uniref:ABC transporter permease n=1 Tax=Paraflavitalea soli TaxID=2315862 RepID=A0A3B7MZ32_9BACT|nr:ABC transporter permease [Paraflavitalea soli]AXY78873.1 ABC transporter permease [Paraflavitalea soli]